MESFNWLAVIGGLAFFFLGLNSARHGLKMAAGDRLRIIMGKVTNNRLLAICMGACITIILQSSSAATVILVSFAETHLLTLWQAIGLILGADIGTTLVVILLSFKKITEYSLLLVATGALLEITTKKRSFKYVGYIILGFGLIFFGMHMMSEAAYPLRSDPAAMKAFEFLADHAVWNLVFATLFTAVIQTSAATIAMAIALSFAGVLSFETAIPIVLGANVGTCITAMLASINAGTEGRRVALAHVLIKVIAVALVFPFIGKYAILINHISGYFANILPEFTTGVSGKIALTHLLFNILLALSFAPFISPIAALVTRIMPSKIQKEEIFEPMYLDKTALDTPALAFAQAKREIMRIADLTSDLFSTSLNMFQKNTNIIIEEEGERIGGLDDKIDILEKAVRFYFAKISQKSLTEEQANAELGLLTIAGELEDIGDIISKEMLPLAQKKSKKMRIFSNDGWKELRKLHQLVMENFELMNSMLAHPHQDIVLKVVRHEEHLNTVEQDLRQSHLNRLHQGLHESFETSSIHLDILSNIRVINAKVTKIVRTAEQVQ